MISINDDRFLAVDTLIDIDKDMEINLSLVEKITAPYNLSVDFLIVTRIRRPMSCLGGIKIWVGAIVSKSMMILRPNSVAGPLSIKIVCVLTV